MASASGIKPKLILIGGNKSKEAETASVIDIGDDDDDDLFILGNNDKRKRPRREDHDDCAIIDGNTKRGKGIAAADDDDCAIIDDAATKKKKFVKVTKKGAAVLDPYLPDNIKAKYHVLEHGGEVYDAVLNRANVSDNSNNFCVIQALESDSGQDFMVFSRWGRVGVEGQSHFDGPFTYVGAAIEEFQMIFYVKTQNVWLMRKDFVPQPKLYTWLEMDYQPQLESRVANFISRICNVTITQHQSNVKTKKHQMVEIGYNAENLPLGKLSKSTILKAHNLLESISKPMTAIANRRTLEQMTGDFYTLIPHDFGSKNIGEFILDTPQKLKSKIEMVEALGEIKLLYEEAADVHEDILYPHYNRLQCELNALDADSKEYSLIEKYMKNTGQGYKADIVHIFRVSRKGEEERFQKYSNSQNRMLLWHGSQLANWTGILSQGLRKPGINPTGVVYRHHNMLGRGIYFADMFVKSAGYCRSTSGSGVLVLCEVALGDEITQAVANHSVCCHSRVHGSIAPDPAESETLDDGVIVPLGKPNQHFGHGVRAGYKYNEYIVYNANQIRMRYLIHVNFNYNNRQL